MQIVISGLLKEWKFFSTRVLRHCLNAYLFLYLVDGKYGFLDLILFLVNHFRFLDHAAPSSLMAGTLMNHACNHVLTEKGKNLTLHNFLLFHLRKTCHCIISSCCNLRSVCFFKSEKLFPKLKLVFHRDIQTPRNNKSTQPTVSCFHLFLGVWIPW